MWRNNSNPCVEIMKRQQAGVVGSVAAFLLGEHSWMAPEPCIFISSIWKWSGKGSVITAQNLSPGQVCCSRVFPRLVWGFPRLMEIVTLLCSQQPAADATWSGLYVLQGECRAEIVEKQGYCFVNLSLTVNAGWWRQILYFITTFKTFYIRRWRKVNQN